MAVTPKAWTPSYEEWSFDSCNMKGAANGRYENLKGNQAFINHFRLDFKSYSVDEFETEIFKRIVYVGGQFLDSDRIKRAVESTSKEPKDIAKLIEEFDFFTEYQTHAPNSESPFGMRHFVAAIAAKHGDSLPKCFTKFNKTFGDEGNEYDISSHSFFCKVRGNEFITSLGKYNDTDKKGILTIINQMTDQNPKMEQAIARLIVEALYNPGTVTRESLFDEMQKEKILFIKQNQVSKDQLNENEAFVNLHASFNRICCLLLLEIFRRPSYEDAKGKPSKGLLSQEFCLITQAMSLQLLSKGKLRMADVFDHDAPYGYPTGQKLGEKKEQYFKDKFFNIYDLYINYLIEANYLVGVKQIADEKMVLTSESLYSVITKTLPNGKMQITPGVKAYRTPDNKNVNGGIIEKQERKRKQKELDMMDCGLGENGTNLSDSEKQERTKKRRKRSEALFGV